MTTTNKPVQQYSRREFLYYFGGASVALLGATTCGLLARFVNPPVQYGINTGLYLIDPEKKPPVGSSPVYFTDRNSYYYFLLNTSEGLIALDTHCPHETGSIRWVIGRQRFVCPLCGSSFTEVGDRVDGPAKQGLARLVLQAYTPSGLITTPEDGSPIPIDEADTITVNTWKQILGAPRT